MSTHLVPVAHCGCLQYDVSLPLSVYYDLVEVMRERVKDVARCTVGYGHVGDGECSSYFFDCE